MLTVASSQRRQNHDSVLDNRTTDTFPLIRELDYRIVDRESPMWFASSLALSARRGIKATNWRQRQQHRQ